MKRYYLFEADHFGFRPVIETDIDYFMLLDADPEIMHFFPNGIRSRDEIIGNIKKYIATYEKHNYGIFSVFSLESGEFIGRAGFADLEDGRTEVGYVILKKYWGQEFGTRILKALLTWAKQNMHKDKVIAFTPANHIASERVMQKVGMVYVGNAIMKGVECVIYEYSLSD